MHPPSPGCSRISSRYSPASSPSQNCGSQLCMHAGSRRLAYVGQGPLPSLGGIKILDIAVVTLYGTPCHGYMRQISRSYERKLVCMTVRLAEGGIHNGRTTAVTINGGT